MGKKKKGASLPTKKDRESIADTMMGKDHGLSLQELDFVHRWFTDPRHNGTRAYLKAFPAYSSENAAAVEACKLLRIPKIVEYIDTLKKELSKRYTVSYDRIMEEYAKLAYSNVQDYYDDDGNLIPIHELPEHAAAAITAMDVIEENNGEAKSRVKKIKLAQKQGALDSLAKIKGMMKDKEDKDLNISIAWVTPPSLPAGQAQLDDPTVIEGGTT